MFLGVGPIKSALALWKQTLGRFNRPVALLGLSALYLLKLFVIKNPKQIVVTFDDAPLVLLF